MWSKLKKSLYEVLFEVIFSVKRSQFFWSCSFVMHHHVWSVFFVRFETKFAIGIFNVLRIWDYLWKIERESLNQRNRKTDNNNTPLHYPHPLILALKTDTCLPIILSSNFLVDFFENFIEIDTILDHFRSKLINYA